MNLEKKKKNLTTILENYLSGNSSLAEIRNFSWEVINYFTINKNTDQLPQKESFENIFWYAIWELQHLADEEHEKDGVLGKQITEILTYLKKEKELPEECFGRRP